MVGNKVQTAVDPAHHLIVAHEVTKIGHDRGQLSNAIRRSFAARHDRVYSLAGSAARAAMIITRPPLP